MTSRSRAPSSTEKTSPGADYELPAMDGSRPGVFYANLYDMKSIYSLAYGAYDLLQGLYNLNTKPIPGRYKNGVTEGAKYFSAKGMARGGIR